MDGALEAWDESETQKYDPQEVMSPNPERRQKQGAPNGLDGNGSSSRRTVAALTPCSVVSGEENVIQRHLSTLEENL